MKNVRFYIIIKEVVRTMISIKNLEFKYRNKEIFNNLNLEFEDKKIISLIGPNGSGKSTLVKILRTKS